MTRRAIGAALAVALAAALAGCSPATSPTPVVIPTQTALPPASATPAPPASPVVGVVVAVQSTGLSKVTGFTLRLAGGRELEFTLGTLDNAAEFAPGHLAEHVATSTPIRVSFREEDGSLVVYRLEDAG